MRLGALDFSFYIRFIIKRDWVLIEWSLDLCCKCVVSTVARASSIVVDIDIVFFMR